MMDDAEKELEQALEDRRKDLGNDHVDTVACAGDFGLLQRDMGVVGISLFWRSQNKLNFTTPRPAPRR